MLPTEPVSCCRFCWYRYGAVEGKLGYPIELWNGQFSCFVHKNAVQEWARKSAKAVERLVFWLDWLLFFNVGNLMGTLTFWNASDYTRSITELFWVSEAKTWKTWLSRNASIQGIRSLRLLLLPLGANSGGFGATHEDAIRGRGGQYHWKKNI